MENKAKILISLFLLIILVILFYFISDSITKYTGFLISEKPFEKDKYFKECLEGRNIILLINTDNPAESLKNNELIEYLDNIKIFNCLRDSRLCIEKGVNSFPSWIINYKKIQGDISVEKLSELSGCEK